MFMKMNQLKKKKMTWKSMILSCYKAEIESRPIKQQAATSQRISLSDISNLSSPMSVDDLSNSVICSKLYAFSLAELSVITHSFARSNLLGEGGFGPVYKGFIDEKLRPGLEAQPVAVKALDLDGLQGHREWLVWFFVLFENLGLLFFYVFQCLVLVFSG